MRLNIGCGNNIRHGYINVDSDARSLPKDVYLNGTKGDLDWLCENHYCDELVAHETIRTFNYNHLRKNVLPNWCKKLKVGGLIKLSFTDIYCFSKLLVNNKITTEQFNETVFGQSDSLKSGICEQTIVSMLLENNMSITTKRYDGLLFYVEAVKNG